MNENTLSGLIKARNFVVKVKLDTSGRKGKSVTVLDGFPKNELFLKELTKLLKNSCGAGGTYYMDRKEGVIEIQSDNRDKVCALLEKNEIKFKR